MPACTPVWATSIFRIGSCDKSLLDQRRHVVAREMDAAPDGDHRPWRHRATCGGTTRRRSRRPQRSWHHCQQLGDLLRVAGGVGSDATAEPVDGRAEHVQLGANRITLDCHSARPPSPHSRGEYGQWARQSGLSRPKPDWLRMLRQGWHQRVDDGVYQVFGYWL